MDPIRRLSVCLMLAGVAACGDDEPPGQGPDDETGSLELTTVSTGEDLDGNGYAIEVDGDEVATVGGNGTATVDQVAAGAREVRLTGVQANCAVAGDNPRSVEVAG